MIIPIVEEYHFLYDGSSIKLMHKLNMKMIDITKISWQNFISMPVSSAIIFGIAWK